MEKPGRNDPCPCGSGKKYKKCCLRKDEEYRMLDIQMRKGDGLFEDEEHIEQDPDYDRAVSRERDDETLIYTIDDDDFEEQSVDSGPAGYDSHTDEDELPEEIIALIDQWWEKYSRCSHFDQLYNHIQEFIGLYPEHVFDLQLHDEPIFVLGETALREQQLEKYINFLIRFRQEFPRSYMESFGSFDADIIYYLVYTDKEDQVPPYLKYFKQFPAKYPDHLFDVISFFQATDCEILLNDLINDIYEIVCTSRSIINGTRILGPLITSCCIPYLDGPCSEQAADQIIERVRTIKYPLVDRYYDSGNYLEMMAVINGPPGEWSLKACRRRNDVIDLYERIAINFAGFLHRYKSFGWVRAFYYMERVLDYLNLVIPDRKKPKHLFIFTRRTISETIGRASFDYLSPDYTAYLCSCTALYWFAEYLETHQHITRIVRNDIQQWCRDLFQEMLPEALKLSFAAHSFQQFPEIEE